MKFLDILRTASANTRRSKARTILTIIAIFIGSMTLTLTNGIGSGIATYIDEQLGNVGAEDVLLVQGKTENPFSGNGPQKYNENEATTTAGGFPQPVLTPDDLDTIESHKGITNVEFDINSSPEYIQGDNDDRYKMTPSTFIDGLNVTLAAGKLPTNGTNEYQVTLPISYVSVLGYDSNEDAVGKTVHIAIKDPTGKVHTVDAKVLGVQEKSLLGATGVLLNRSLAQRLFDYQSLGFPEDTKSKQPLALARFEKNMSEKDLETLKKDLDKEGYTATTIQDQIGVLKQVIDAVIMVLNFFAGIALLAASFGIVNTLFMAVQERTKEIGLMKALGMGRRKIFLLFSIEAVLLGFWGSLLGSLAGMGVGKIANQVATKTFLKDLNGFELTSFPWQSVAVIMLIVMAIAFLAGTLPARRASKKDPIEALRYE